MPTSLCTKCNLNPSRNPDNNQPWCKKCYADYERQRRKDLLQKGLCYSCGRNPRALDTRGSGRGMQRLANLCLECAEDKAKFFATLRQVNKLAAVRYLGSKCVDCGLQTDHIEVYDFHHINPLNKEANPSSLMQKSWEVLLREIKKCALLCANCHRIREAKEENTLGIGTLRRHYPVEQLEDPADKDGYVPDAVASEPVVVTQSPAPVETAPPAIVEQSQAE